MRRRRLVVVVVVTWVMRSGVTVVPTWVSCLSLLRRRSKADQSGMPPFKPGEKVQLSIGDDI